MHIAEAQREIRQTFQGGFAGQTVSGQLATQVAFTIPLALPVVVGATLHRLDWFYPATMVIVGAHYLPFVFLYGMPAFAALGGAMIAGGVLFGLNGAGGFAVPGWATGAALLAFALIGRAIAAREAARGSDAAA